MFQDEVVKFKKTGYDSYKYYENNPVIKRIVD